MRVINIFIFSLMAILLQAQSSNPVASFTLSDNSICANSALTVSDRSTGDIIHWNWHFEGGSPSSSDNRDPGTIFYKTPGIYSIALTVTSENGNIDSESFTLIVLAFTPAVILVEPAQGQAPLNVQISTTAPAGQSTWNVDGMSFSGMSALSHIYNKAGTFDVCLVTQNNLGCKDSACVDVMVWEQTKLDSSFLVVPNVFTPNNDLQNDIFRTISLNIVEWDSRIYDRWGQLVYKSVTPDLMWDGVGNGRPCEDGIYVYTIKAVGGDGKLYDISGTLTLFR